MDTVEQSQPVTDIQYTIGAGPSTISTNIENLFEECQVTFELTQNGQPYDTSIFTLDENDREIIIETDDLGLNGQVFDFVLTVTDEAGN